MTRLNKFVSKDTFKRMFHDAEYNKSPDYDFVVDGKTYKTRAAAHSLKKNSWSFVIPGNQNPDIYALMAFDNGDDLNLLHMWFMPRDVYKKFATIVVYQSNISRWDEYRIDAGDL